MKKRIISIFLIVGLLAGMFSIGAAAASHPFTDVKSNAWYAGNVQYVYEKGLMAGTAPTTFSPDVKMNRAMLVAVLYRMDGSKAVSGSTPFTDIKTSEYYYSALVWAYNNGIISGTAPTKFSPSAPITREMMVAIFHRYANYLKLDTNKAADLSKFTDAGKVSTYAWCPFQWAVEVGIIAGDTPTTLNPKGTATRAECAAVLERFGKWAENNAVVEPGPTEPEPTKPTEPEPTKPGVTKPTEPVHTHSYTSKVTKEATCTEEGTKTYTCSCGDSYTEAIPAAGHSYVAEVTKEATCTENGVKTYICSKCGDSYTETIPAAGHDWEVIHHDEVGHWDDDVTLTCRCGWTCTESEANAAGYDRTKYWYFVHKMQFDIDERPNHTYDESILWIVDIPAYDEWICSVCGEVSSTEP